MANKYQKHSRAHLTRNLKENMRAVERELDDILDEDHKESMEERASRIRKTFAVAMQMFDVLMESGLVSEGRDTALSFLVTLNHRFGGGSRKGAEAHRRGR